MIKPGLIPANYDLLIVLGSMVLAIVAFGVALFVCKQAPAVKQLNAELEIRVEERTDELRNAIAQLQFEMTERKLVVEALRDSEARMQLALDAAQIGVWDFEIKTGKVTWSNVAESLLGLSAISFAGTENPYFNCVHPEDQNAFTQVVQSALATGIGYEHEHHIIWPDGTIRWFEVKADFVRDKIGSLERLTGVTMDISDRKQAEEALAERARLAAFHVDINTALSRNDGLQGILLHSTKAIVRHLDAAFARIWTLNAKENVLEMQASAGMYTHIDGPHSRVPVGKFKIGFIAHERQPHLTNSVLDDPRVSDQDWARREGMVAFAGYPLMSEDQLVGVIAMFARKPLTESTLKALELAADEITLGIKRQQAEEALRQSEAQSRQQATMLKQALQELQQTQAQLVQTEKMSSLGQLVAGVAHEINNPVSFVYGNLTYASQYTQDLLHLLQLYQQHYPHPALEIQAKEEAIELEFLLEDLPKILSSMQMGAERICQIVLSLRNFSRLDESEMKLVDIHEGIDSTLLILQNRLKANGENPAIEVIKEYGILPRVECYAGQMNQVFMNILSNAIDALEDKIRGEEYPSPCIWIRTEVRVGNQVAICIADNGPGMMEAVRDKLFDPFFTTKPVGKGTGLGLSISYQIVIEKHGGQLRCISAPRQGAEFVIEIPIRQPHSNNLM